MGYSNLCKSIVAIANKCNPRNGKKIVKITPHHMAGIMTGEACAKYHRDSAAQASANYYIGNDGAIVGGVDEANRAWTSSSYDNDVQAITIEVSNSTTGGDWPVSSAAYQSLVKLCADICTRYGINPHFNGGPSGTITYHKMFASTSCPGPWLQQKIDSGQFESDIKKAMGQASTPAASKTPIWDKNAVLKVGDKVKSVSCAVGVAKGNLVDVPALGGFVPLADVTESSDSKDGNPKDDNLSNGNARCYFHEHTVAELKCVSGDWLCRCQGCDYWIKCEPLMALR